MFFKGSRYEKAPTVIIPRKDGTQIVAVRPLQRAAPTVALVHPRHEGERLDHIAARFLSDATTFWRLCDASNAMSAEALGAHKTIPVPKRG
jgi:hypothetical protein